MRMKNCCYWLWRFPVRIGDEFQLLFPTERTDRQVIIRNWNCKIRLQSKWCCNYILNTLFAEKSSLYKLLSMKLFLWINKVVIEKLSYSLPVAINAVAGITDYQPNQIRTVNFLSWKAQNACIDSLWSSYQMKSSLKACWNEQVKNLLELNTLNIKCRVFPLTWSMSKTKPKHENRDQFPED